MADIARPARNPSLLVGALLTLTLVIAALVSLVWTPWPVNTVDIANRFRQPSVLHLLGTDSFGRDTLSLLMAGARNSFLVALVAVVIGAGIGIPLGTLAAARGGWLDEVAMRLSDFVFAFPALLSAVLITSVWGPGAFNAMIAIGLFNIPVFARVARGGALVVWARPFAMAARALGKGELGITLEHVLPNIASLLIVQATIQFAMGILAEAAFSYLGLGTQPPAPSLGKMLYEAQTLMYQAPRLAILPGVTIMLAVMGFNLLGDGLADLLDPKLRRLR